MLEISWPDSPVSISSATNQTHNVRWSSIREGFWDQRSSGAQTEGMIRMNAITDISEQIVEPASEARSQCFQEPGANLWASVIHHHGKEGITSDLRETTSTRIALILSCTVLQSPTWRSSDTIVYAAQGHGVIVSGPNGSKKQELSPGDFALIPCLYWASRSQRKR